MNKNPKSTWALHMWSEVYLHHSPWLGKNSTSSSINVSLWVEDQSDELMSRGTSIVMYDLESLDDLFLQLKADLAHRFF